MILVVDVGNTNITCGVYEKDVLTTTFRITTKIPRTSDEYGVLMKDMLKNNDIATEDIEGVIIASVVPNVMHALVGAINRYVGKNPLIVGPGIKTGIMITSDNPREEEPMDIIQDILIGVKKAEGAYVMIPDRKEAIAYCMEHAQDGDIIVLAGKGHEDYQEIKGVKYDMDDRVLIAEVLEELKG